MVTMVVTFFTGFFKSLLSKRDYKLGWNIQIPDGQIFSISRIAKEIMYNYERYYAKGFYVEVEPLPNNHIYAIEWYPFAFFSIILNWYKERGIDIENYDPMQDFTNNDDYQKWWDDNIKTPMALFVSECVTVTGSTFYLKPMVDNFYDNSAGIIPEGEIEPSDELEGSVNTWYAKFTTIHWVALAVVGWLLFKSFKK